MACRDLGLGLGVWLLTSCFLATTEIKKRRPDARALCLRTPLSWDAGKTCGGQPFCTQIPNVSKPESMMSQPWFRHLDLGFGV